MKKILSTLLVFGSIIFEPNYTATKAAELGETALPSSTRFSIHSDDIDQTYFIDVRVPQSYSSGDTSYPVLYVTDGNPLFQLVTGGTQLLELGGVPESIIVGISYDGSFMDQLILRERDMTPTNNQEWDELAHQSGFLPETMKSGGAPLFLNFVTKTVKPLINSKYRVLEDSETLLGHSNGGLFGLYTLFSYPDSFDNYILTSPATGWDNEVIFEIAVEFGEREEDLSKKLFLAAGTLEPPTNTYTRRLYDILEGFDFPSLEIEFVAFEGETHTSVVGAALSRGIRFVYGSQ